MKFNGITKTMKNLFLIALCLIVGSLPTTAMAISDAADDLYIETRISEKSPSYAWVPVKQTMEEQTSYGSAYKTIFTYKLKAVKGRKITGTVSCGDSQKITLTYNKKGALTSYTTTESGYAPETTKLKNGILSCYKVTKKKYTASKVLKSATVKVTPYINGEGTYFEETYYTSGKQKGLIKTQKEYYTSDNGTTSTLNAANTFKYTVDSHGNVTKMTKVSTSTDIDGSSTVTAKTVTKVKYRKIALKK